MPNLVLIVASFGGVIFLAYFCTLIFWGFVIVRTGSTTGLRDVAYAMRAFAHIGSFRRSRQP